MWIKVCGVKDVAAARMIADSGVDAIGINFYKRSLRCVALPQAIAISAELPESTKRVGVFVNHPIAELVSISQQCRLDFVQLHGDEPPSYFSEIQRRLPQIQLIRAFRMGSDGLTGLSTFLSECPSHKVQIAYCLIDAAENGSYGGTGKTAPWGQIRREYRHDTWPPIILAGGLRPANVLDAIEAVSPFGVDVASGVETSPGVKDPALVKLFIEQVRKSGADRNGNVNRVDAQSPSQDASASENGQVDSSVPTSEHDGTMNPC
jgi:phosphoribosylanthranilate isomerase